MSSNNIKDCQCFHFPNGKAISASEHAKQKANIQIFKNNVLLNCNNSLPRSNTARRVYSGSQNRIRSINGLKLTNQKCEDNSSCIFSEKNKADFWINTNTINDPRFTRISSNPSIEILVKGPLDKNVLQSLAEETGNNGFLNPTEIIIGSEVTSISSDLLEDISGINKRLTTFGFKSLITKCISIDTNAFRDCQQLQTLNIPNSVITIGEAAFRNCLLLQTVTIPDSVTTIGKSAFHNCILLKTLTIGDSVSTIQENAFRECKLLQTLTLPDSVISIGKAAFRGCVLLNTVTFGNSVETISEEAFRECGELTSLTLPTSLISIGPNIIFRTNITTINIPPNVTQIDEGAFASPTRSLLTITIDPTNSNFKILDNVLFNHDFTLLLCYPSGRTDTEYTIPNTVTKIGRSSISNCTTLETINIPSSVTTIGEAAFFSNINLTNLNIPSSVTSFEVGFNFFNCRSLTNINIPNGVQFLGEQVFRSCVNLTTVNIPTSVTTIDKFILENTFITTITIPRNVTAISEGAFGKSRLQSISIDENNRNFRVVNNVLFNSNMQILLFYPRGKLDSSYTLPRSVKRIGDSAFEYSTNIFNDNLQTINIQIFSISLNERLTRNINDLLSIGSFAFRSLRVLRNINIPNSVRTIEKNAFFGCISLTTINIPTSLTTIEQGTFELCRTLTNINIPNNITVIEDRAFAGCESLVNIIIPDSVTSIGENAFFSIAATSIHIPANVTHIKDGAFNNPQLELITIDFNNKNFRVENNVLFNNNMSVILCYPAENPSTRYNIPKSATIISGHTFTHSSNLQTINIPSNVTLIKNAAFEACSNLTSLTIPESLSFIAADTFFNCVSLRSIIIPSSILHIEEFAFFNCQSLRSVTFNKAPTNPIIRRSAFLDTPLNDIIFFNDLDGTRTLVVVDRTTENAVYSNALIVTFNDGSTHTIFPASCDTDGINNALPPGLTDIRDINVNPSINSFTQINNNAFENYTGESITIPSSVRRIGDLAFSQCSILNTVTFKANIETTIGTQVFTATPVVNVSVPGAGTPTGAQLNNLTGITITDNNDVIYTIN